MTSNPALKPIADTARVNTSKRNQGMFESWNWPDYVYVEYPKWIGEGANRTLVHSKRDEIIARGENPEAFAEPENPVVRENLDLKKQLEDMQKQIDSLLKSQQAQTSEVKIPLKKVER